MKNKLTFAIELALYAPAGLISMSALANDRRPA